MNQNITKVVTFQSSGIIYFHNTLFFHHSYCWFFVINQLFHSLTVFCLYVHPNLLFSNAYLFAFSLGDRNKKKIHLLVYSNMMATARADSGWEPAARNAILVFHIGNRAPDSQQTGLEPAQLELQSSSNWDAGVTNISQPAVPQSWSLSLSIHMYAPFL